MNCREYRRSLTSGSGANRTARERHRERCDECAIFALRFEALEAHLARPASAPEHRIPPPGFSARVMSSLPEPPSPLEWASLRLLPLTAALALTLLAWCLVATPAPSDLWSEASETDVLTWVTSDDL